MKLTDEQRQRVSQWILDGVKLSDIQSRLAAEFGVKLTYMETRFLVDDLKIMPKDPEPVKVPELAATKPATPPPATIEGPSAGGIDEEEIPATSASNVSVTVDQITQPGTVVSGKVTFSDGQSASWYLDQMGRLGLAAKQKGYKPSAADVQAFQMALQREMQKLGY